MTDRILRRPEVEYLTGLSCTTIYDRMASNEFPRSIPLGGRMVGWKLSSIENWIEGQAEKAGGQSHANAA